MKVLAVCGFGVGSSMILKMSLEKVFKKLGVSADVENTDITSAKSDNPDVIFTSEELYQELKGTVKAPIYPVKKYMDLVEIEAAVSKYLSEK